MSNRVYDEDEKIIERQITTKELMELLEISFKENSTIEEIANAALGLHPNPFMFRIREIYHQAILEDIEYAWSLGYDDMQIINYPVEWIAYEIRLQGHQHVVEKQ